MIYLPRFVADSSTLERKDDGAELLGSIPRHGRAHVGAQVLEGGSHHITAIANELIDKFTPMIFSVEL